MTKIIDMRLRPPYKSFSETSFYKDYDTPKAREKWQSGTAVCSQAALKRSMEYMIQEMDENNVAIGVAVARETSWGSPAKNDDLIGLLGEYPGRFIGVPHFQADGEKDMLELFDEYILNGPCKGIYLEPGFRLEKIKRHANDKVFFPLYEKAMEHDVPIILQYGGGKASIEYYTPWDIYNIAETFPKLKICISHGGWPQVMAMIHEAYAHENVYLSPDDYFNGYPGSKEYIEAAKTILTDKIMFGSTFPCVSLPDVVAKYEAAGLTQEQLEKVYYKNAAKFWGIE